MRRILLLLAALTPVLTGCTGVPHSSSPEIVRSVAVGNPDQNLPPETPAPGVQPNRLVTTFLAANSADAGRHASARSFLTPAARSRWTDTAVTVVADGSESVGSYAPGKPLVVNATALGTVNQDGIYTPELQTGKAAAVQFSFGISTVAGQYRISSLGSGLVLTQTQFREAFVPRSVYFFDLAHRYLVPDARWTPDTDPVDVTEALVNELAVPSTGVQNAVSTDTLPAQTGARHIDVTGSDPVKIEIAGASQLDPTSKNRLAAQLAATLSDVDRGRSLQITDSGAPVRIPKAGGADFVPSDFGDDMVVTPDPEVYYIRSGQIFDQTRQLVRGPVNDARYPLTSVALSHSGPGGYLTMAGVTAVDGVRKLVMGSQTTGVKRTTVTGVTSRPAFAPGQVGPGRVEAWVGAGARIYRSVLSGSHVTSYAVQLPTIVTGQQVIALRLSPEGSRIALVLRDNTGRQKLYTGAVVRSTTQVSLTGLQQISPSNVTVNDVAWIEGERLNAIGYDSSSQDAHVYSTGADGSAWTESSIGLLPGPPTSLAGAPGAPAWASANSSVYLQASGTVWSNPDDNTSTVAGVAPTYVE